MFGMVTDGRPDGFKVSDYSTAEQTVALVWHFTGVIDNAGIGGLFGRDIPGDPDFMLLRNAFGRIDCQPAERALTHAFAVFPGGVAPTDGDVRREILEQLSAEREHELSSEFWGASERRIPHALARYIERMQEAGDLPSAP
jgi:hypothetical protein